MQQRELFEKVKRGEATQAERDQLLEWIDSCDSEVDEYISEYFTQGLDQNIIWDDEPVLEKLRERIADEDPSKVISINRKHWTDEVQAYEAKSRRMHNYGTYWRVASLVLILTSIITYFSIPKSEQASEVRIVYNTKTTENGQKMSFYLPDGSKVVLNANSSLVFPNNFSAERRDVSLSGEAYFEVVEDVNRPFVVESGGYATRVLGTSFVVKRNYVLNDLEVALRTGKVQVTGNGASEVLVPGEKVNIDLDNSIIAKSTFDDMEYFGWTKGILYFQEVSFDEVVDRLERWYGVFITVENMPSTNKKYSGHFENENLENVLEGLSFINKFDYSINNKKVMIQFE